MNIQHAVLFVLTVQLGSDDFRTREAAHAALVRAGDAALPYLEAAEKCGDAEASRRAGQVIDRWYSDNAARIAAEICGTRPPWISGDNAHWWLEMARQQIGTRGPPDWTDYRLATRMMVEGMVKRRSTASEVREVLDRFAKCERQWIDEHGHRYGIKNGQPGARVTD